jgi:hypothetical protein
MGMDCPNAEFLFLTAQDAFEKLAPELEKGELFLKLLVDQIDRKIKLEKKNYEGMNLISSSLDFGGYKDFSGYAPKRTIFHLIHISTHN